MPAPAFGVQDNWASYSGKLFDWGTEVWKRHQQYVEWVETNCRAKPKPPEEKPGWFARNIGGL